MDVDSDGMGGCDIESSLLHQFSCLGTTDKDELVKQMQKLFDNQLNYSTAVFFLDMNNWNLQAAVCSYLDIDSQRKLPSMVLIVDSLVSEVESIEPNICFQKSWHICNNGAEEWPPGCYARCADGFHSETSHIVVPILKPQESTHLVITLKSPSCPGTYQSKWRLCTPNGAYFGDPLWVIINVVEEGTIKLTQQLSHFNELGYLPDSDVTRNPFLIQCQADPSSTESKGASEKV